MLHAHTGLAGSIKKKKKKKKKLVEVYSANSHLRIKDASLWFNDTDGSIVSCKWEDIFPILRGDNAGQKEPQILGVHFSRKAVAETLRLASIEPKTVACGTEIADIDALLRIESPQRAANKVHTNRGSLIVGEGNDGFGWVTIDQFDAKNFGSRWEGHLSQYIQPLLPFVLLGGAVC